jgi:hypothetical protein
MIQNPSPKRARKSELVSGKNSKESLWEIYEEFRNEDVDIGPFSDNQQNEFLTRQRLLENLRLQKELLTRELARKKGFEMPPILQPQQQRLNMPTQPLQNQSRMFSNRLILSLTSKLALLLRFSKILDDSFRRNPRYSSDLPSMRIYIDYLKPSIMKRVDAFANVLTNRTVHEQSIALADFATCVQ